VAISGNLSFDFLLSKSNITCMIISTLFMGSVYPLTQIYQHESDKNDDIITLSYKLGYIGTFLFSSLLFMLATILLYFHFESIDQKFNFQLFIFLMTPVVIYMIYWCYKIYTNYKYANYTYTMLMNLITAVFMNLFFTILIFK
jgi:1,4-dihydroxy-2-naphthoate octaprenyltransferase